MKNLWIASLFLMGCTTGGGGLTFKSDLAVAPDLKGGSGGDMAMSMPDLAMSNNKPDLAMNGGMCVADPNYGALGTKKGQAVADDDGAGNQILLWEGPIDSQMLPTLLSVQFYAGAGAFKGSTTVKTGTFQIAGQELNFATCGVCVLLFTQVDTKNMTQGPTYLATGGTVKITSVNGTLAATVSNVTFEHVQIDPDTYESTPDADMCQSAITSVAFSDTIM